MRFIGIVGSRRRDGKQDFVLVTKAFYKIYQPGDLIVSGGCKKGGDRFAEILSRAIKEEPILFLPNEENLDSRLPIRAAWAKINYARNTLVAKKSDELIACVAYDRKGGTEHTIKEFERLHPGKKAILV